MTAFIGTYLTYSAKNKGFGGTLSIRNDGKFSLFLIRHFFKIPVPSKKGILMATTINPTYKAMQATGKCTVKAVEKSGDTFSFSGRQIAKLPGVLADSLSWSGQKINRYSNPFNEECRQGYVACTVNAATAAKDAFSWTGKKLGDSGDSTSKCSRESPGSTKDNCSEATRTFGESSDSTSKCSRESPGATKDNCSEATRTFGESSDSSSKCTRESPAATRDSCVESSNSCKERSRDTVECSRKSPDKTRDACIGTFDCIKKSPGVTADGLKSTGVCSRDGTTSLGQCFSESGSFTGDSLRTAIIASSLDDGQGVMCSGVRTSAHKGGAHQRTFEEVNRILGMYRKIPYELSQALSDYQKEVDYQITEEKCPALFAAIIEIKGLEGDIESKTRKLKNMIYRTMAPHYIGVPVSGSAARGKLIAAIVTKMGADEGAPLLN